MAEQRRTTRYIVLALIAIALTLWWARSRSKGGDDQAQSKPAQADDTSSRKQTPRLKDSYKVGLKNGKRPGMWMLEDPKLPRIIADFLVRWRYDPSSRRLKADQWDLLEPNRRFETRGALRHVDGTTNPDMKVLFTGDKFRLMGEQSIKAKLTVTPADKSKNPPKVTIKKAFAEASSLETHAKLDGTSPVVFQAAGDNVHTAAFAPAKSPWKGKRIRILLKVEFDYGGDKLGAAQLDLLYQSADDVPATFTGTFSEEVKDGSLVVSVGVEVKKAGFYVIDANFFGQTGQPIAAPRGKVELKVGSTQVPLLLYGKLLRDVGLTPPFTMSHLRGYLVDRSGGYGKKHMPPYDGVHVTKGYQLSEFSDDEFWSDRKQQTLNSLLEQAQLGRKHMLKQTQEEARETGWKPDL